jgi:hypothetical protein
MVRQSGLISLIVLLGIHPGAWGQPVLVDAIPIFHGEARTGDGRRIPGSVAFTVRVISQDGPIEALNFTGVLPQNPFAFRGVTGRACQRWTASDSDANYDTPSPGFSTITNLMGEESLDTHFLFNGNSTDYAITSPLTEGGVLFHGGNPFPSTATTGYGLGGQGIQPGQGLLQGAWSFGPAVQASSVDAIYVAAGGTVNVLGSAMTKSGWNEFGFSVLLPAIPEPSATIIVMLLGVVVSSARTPSR